MFVSAQLSFRSPGMPEAFLPEMMAGLLLFMPPEIVETVLAQVAFSS
jgi:hypothetical protein